MKLTVGMIVKDQFGKGGRAKIYRIYPSRNSRGNRHRFAGCAKLIPLFEGTSIPSGPPYVLQLGAIQPVNAEQRSSCKGEENGTDHDL